MTHTVPANGTGAPPGNTSSLLRLALFVDCVSTAVMGAVLIIAVSPLSSATGMPVAFTLGFGGYQLAWAVALGLLLRRPALPPGAVRGVIALNAVAALCCVTIAFGDVIELTGFGVAFMLIGTVIVAVFAALQYVGLRRMSSRAA